MSLKRFYRGAEAVPAADGFAIHLDGRPVKTPVGRLLIVPTAGLAASIATEWRDQGERVVPASMPMTQLAATALDRVGPERAAIVAQALNYAATDLLCYRAREPADLVERQTRAWQPLLDWAGAELGAELAVTTGILAVAQPPAALARLAARIEGHDLWRLTALQAACAAAGSLILALALVERRLTAAEAFALSQVDETFQSDLWGEDAEAALARAALARDIEAAGRLLDLL